ncbi:NepR family anti-sigma factor [Maritimibacter sp. HL-12]|uniref:NepR family anti-sigma factor n=1 Tax=Maritimibacter sp. HL-12 TaxID=1162418 RepID=UPI000A1CE66D|nr:NepR family anti-sigma factor [Maritimibacter sp. HL-12]
MTDRKASADNRRDDDDAPVPPAIEQQINENLQRLYRPTLEEDLPDRLKQLLARLEDRETVQDEDGSK